MGEINENKLTSYARAMYGISGDIANTIFVQREQSKDLNFKSFISSLADALGYKPSITSFNEKDLIRADFIKGLKELPEAVRNNLSMIIIRTKSNRAQIKGFQEAINALTDAVTERLAVEGAQDASLVAPLLAEMGDDNVENN